MKKFVKLQALENSKNIERLRFFYDPVEVSVWKLKTLGVEINTCGSLLIYLITEKFSGDLRLRIDRKIWEFSENQNLV